MPERKKLRSPATAEDLEERLSAPSDADRAFMHELDGDIMVLGAGGKIGPSLAKLAKRAAAESGSRARVIAVSRFHSEATWRELEAAGVRVIACDLLNPREVGALPDCENVLYLAGRKFGSAGRPDLTWAMNAVAPALAAYRYRHSSIVVFSTGNVYGMRDVSVESSARSKARPHRAGGSRETDAPEPVGEYAQSCVARERIFEYHANEYGTHCLLFRLNYAVDLRYGVLVDIARKVYAGEPVDVTVPAFNVIWQRDANSYALRALALCSAPARILNVTGAETVRVRDAAEALAKRFGRTCSFTGEEGSAALLSDASVCYSLLGRPAVSSEALQEWVADWIEAGGESLEKPTHFEVIDGTY